MTLAFAPERIEQWPLARLQPYAKNAKLHGPEQVAKLAASMAEFGWTVPCLVAEDGELIAGGEDEDGNRAATRDRMIPDKTGRLEAQLSAMTGTPCAATHRWAADFGSSPDGLPAIGKARNADHVWLAAGFGGNGITFAALGAELIAAALTGAPDPDADCFDPYRFES